MQGRRGERAMVEPSDIGRCGEIKEKLVVDMDVGLEVEDEVFFADLSKQIALLIMDDEDGQETFLLQSPSTSFQQWQASPPSSQPAAWPMFFSQQACGGMVGGTGVFIPRTSVPRKKRRSGRPRQPRKTKLDANAKQQQPEAM
ncbi:hypothetical protein Taro_006170 [Colocasia esculenta]|uniref:Uncharacterized protein n=1 Tax=Colocasia esculenta TaxID=4460 RepID=A0A843TMZ1_COLES|nr:hypothetical protein [Colocasia esculenta]